MAEEIPVWAPDLPLLSFPSPVPLFYETTPWGPRTIADRARILARLTTRKRSPSAGGPLLILAAARGVMTRTLPAETFAEHSRRIVRGDAVRPDSLVEFLLGTGYASGTTVVTPGQFARRGGILDVWPPELETPVRLEFFGNQIDTLRSFDPATQVSEADVEQLDLTPAREGLPMLARAPWTDSLPPPPPGASLHEPTLEFLLPTMAADPVAFFDYLPAGSLVVFDDRASLEEAVNELEEQAVALRKERLADKSLRRDFPLPYLPLEDVRDAASDFTSLDLGYLNDAADEDVWGDRFSAGPRFAGQLRRLTEHLAQALVAHETCVVVSRQAPRLAEIWSEVGPARPVLERLPVDPAPGELAFLHGALSEGWRLQLDDEQPLHLLTDAEVFGWGRPQSRLRPVRTTAAPETPYADLQPGDWIVHEDYGVGRFRDLVERTLDGLRREYLLIEYADGGQVYVPIHHADRISRYVGVEGAPPSPARLGTQEWERAKGQAREAAEEVARDLLDLYARRMTAQGYAFSPDTAWQHELEASFAYTETDDQLQAIDAVREDMERSRPMDRLICGDVGYGKTEVALRAAFKAVQDSKQVAVLVPTTVLAQQHYRTFRERLSPFPVEVEMLSRFRSRGEATSILRRLSDGSIDILIGTHRLLQRDVEFRDLGLLIIDEEQRFGVTHKEYLKRLRTEVDVLTLTATPIPRTLYLALTGARDISTINTPPDERLPVSTHIGPYDPALVRQAILRELDRGGQVFFVHNRVQTIPGGRAARRAARARGPPGGRPRADAGARAGAGHGSFRLRRHRHLAHHQHYRVRPGFPERQYVDRRPVGLVRPGPALPASRPRRARNGTGVRLFLPPARRTHGRGGAATAGDPGGAHSAGCGLQHRHAGSRAAGSRRDPGDAPARSHRRHRLPFVHATPGGGRPPPARRRPGRRTRPAADGRSGRPVGGRYRLAPGLRHPSRLRLRPRPCASACTVAWRA